MGAVGQEVITIIRLGGELGGEVCAPERMVEICWLRVVRSWAALLIGSTDSGLEGTSPLPVAFRRALSQLAGELYVGEVGLLIPRAVEPKLKIGVGGKTSGEGMCISFGEGWGKGRWKLSERLRG